MKKAIYFIIVLITFILTLTPKLYAHLPAPIPPPANTIFVATDGDDSYTGSYTAPVKSLNRALYLAGIDGTIDQIYIAVGTYNETNILELRSNLLIEGGFDRNNNWAKTGLATIININSIEHIDANISHKIGFRSNNDTYWILKDLTIFVASATTGDRSSSGRGASVYGLYITGNGAGNQIINCSITAGNGGTGANGINGANGSTGNGGSNGEKGGCANSNGDGGGGGSTIGSGIRAGGSGGSGSRGGEGGAFSTAYGSSAGNSGIRGGSGSGGAYGTGGAGAPAKNNGYPGNPGSNGNNGTLTVINPTFNWGGYFTPAAQGATGSDGYGGGGAGGGSGGGGAGSYSRGGGGGGGGGGGQGGAGGTGGHGGGGSFVLFCYNSSTPEISGTTLVKGNGGAGGTGGSGGIGGNGGVGGAGVGAATCSGKTGGNGGTGGKGGNGAAGENGTAGTSEIIAFVNNSTLVTHDISIPIVRDDESCSSSINISAIPGYGGTTCRWYDVNQTTLLATTTTFSTTISGNTTFYVATYNANISYESTEKVPINIILHPTPGIPGTTPDSRCEPGTVNLAATPGSNGTTCRWYTDITCTNLIHTGNSYSPSLNNTTNYYVTSYNTTTGCEGQPTTITGTVLFNSPNTYVAGEICQGATYHQYGFSITSDQTQFSGTLIDTLFTTSTVTGCDSNVILTLTINPLKTTEWSQTVCDSFTWNSSTYYSTGDYVQNFFTTKGCDSTVTLHLTVNYTAPTTFIFDTVCQGNPYSNYGFVVSADSTNTPGVFSDTLYTSRVLTGCDSTVILNLTINPVKTTEWSQTVCDSIIWNSSTYYSTGDYVQHFLTEKGCDSTVTLHLTVNYSAPTTFIFDTICQGNPYSNYGFIISADSTDFSGILLDTLNTSRVLTGCDSTVILNLTINPIKTTEWSQTVCDSFTWNSSTYNTTGDYVQHFFTDKGCDSTVTLHLTVNYTAPTTFIFDTICQGNPYSNYGFVVPIDSTNTPEIFSDTIFTSCILTGCDSTVILNLTINPIKTTEWSQTICDSFTWNSSTYYTSGDYVQHFFTDKGCDSTVTLHLTINYTAPTTFIFDTICQGNSYSNYGFIVPIDSTNTPGIFTDTLNTSRVLTGCDSTVILNLTINPVKTTEWSQTICDSFTWNSSTYYSTGDYVQHFFTDKGCDSTVTLHLMVNYTSPTTYILDTICQGNPYSNYGFDVPIGSTNTPGIFSDTLHTSRVLTGCDSTVILNLTINPVKTTEYSQTVCDSFIWNSSTYYRSGNYVQHFLTEKGCDSTVTLHLTVNYSAPVSYYFGTICQGTGYTGYGFHIPAANTLVPGTLCDTLYSVCPSTGCDSVSILTLTIRPTKTSEFYHDVCDSFRWNDSVYHTSGDYVQYFSTNEECDSIVTLHLIIRYSSPITYIYDSICPDTEYDLYGFFFPREQTNLPRTINDTLFLFSTATGCDSTVILSLTINAESDTTYIQDHICYGDTYLQYGFNLPNLPPGTSTFLQHAYDRHGCDSIVILTLNVLLPVSTHLFDTICQHEPYSSFGFNIPSSANIGTFNYFAHYNSRFGCDSTVFLSLTIKEVPQITHLYDTICQGSGYNDFGFNISANSTNSSGNYRYIQSLFAANHCDSIIYLHLTINPKSDTLFISDYICFRENYTLHGFNIIRPNAGIRNYVQVLTNQYGCDSIVFLTLNVHFPVTTRIFDTICQYSSYQENGFNTLPYDTLGIFNDFRYEQTAYGCDSIILLTLTVKATSPTVYIYDTICQGSPYQNHNFTISSDSTSIPGSFIYQNTDIHSTSGCDSTTILMLTINPTKRTSVFLTSCDSIIYNNIKYYQSGEYYQYFLTNKQCDSIVTLHITINETAPITLIHDTICQGGSYLLNGFSIVPPLTLINGLLTDTLYDYRENSGCDSIVILQLLVKNMADTTFIHDAICQGMGYNYHGFNLGRQYIPGTFEYNRTYVAQNGCDSIVILSLSVNQTYTTRIYDTICQHTIYQENGFNLSYLNTAGEYDFFLYTSSQEGCDSLILLTLTVQPASDDTHISASICQGEVYQQYGFNIPSDSTLLSGIYYFNNLYINQYGCDSLVILTLTINPLSDTTQLIDNICVGEPYYEYGFQIDAPIPGQSTHIQHLINQFGCDSIVQLSLSVHSPNTTQIIDTICQYEPYIANGFSIPALNNPGLHHDYFTINNQFGCDSVVLLTLLVQETPPVTYIFDTVCQNNPYNDFGFFISTNRTSMPGIVNDTLFLHSTITGCDSTVILNLTIHPNYQIRFNATACDSYTWNDSVYNTSGEYTQYFLSQFGCDSIVTLDLTINYTLPITYIFDTVCQNNPYNDFGFFISTNRTALPGTVNDTLFLHSTITGCDSTVVLNLTIHPNYQIRFNATACDSYTWNNSVYNTSGEYTQYFLSQFGCDSVVTLDLTINYTLPITYIFDTICQNNPYNDFGFFIPTNRTALPGTVNDTLFLHSTITGCDSTIILNLTIHPNYQIRFNATACDSYTWNDSVYNTSGEYTQYFLSQFGCDSVVTLDLTINYTLPITYIFDTVCQNNPYNDFGFFIPTNRTALPGTINDTLFLYSTITGCDSTVVLHLTIHPNYQIRFNATACDSYTWNDSIYNTSGEYTLYFLSQFGCDSIVTLDLTINYTLPITYIFDTVCQNNPYNDFGFFIPENITGIPGRVNDTLFLHSTITGCDSTVVLQLTIHPNYQIRFNATACDSYTWNDSVYNTSGEYTQYFLSQFGCDSVVTLDLTINYTLPITYIFDTVCQNNPYNDFGFFIPENRTSIPRTVNDTLFLHSTMTGCDSIVILQLTIHPNYQIRFNATACDSYTWNDSVYYTSGEYTQYFLSQFGCDSVVTLDLTINYTLPITYIFDTVCQNNPYNDFGFFIPENRTALPGTVNDTLFLHSTITGCDSTVILQLTIHPNYQIRFNATACDSYTWNDSVYYTSGEYTQYFLSQFGCDSIVTLDLTINYTLPVTYIFDTVCQNNPYNDFGFFIPENITSIPGTVNDTLFLHSTITGCDSTMILNLTIHPNYQRRFSIVSCDRFIWNDSIYTLTGEYTQYFLSQFGCDSVVTLDLTINQTLPLTYIFDTICQNQPYNNWGFVVPESLTTIPGVLSDTLFLASTMTGCDSNVVLHLTIHPNYQIRVEATSCDSFTWNDSIYYISGEYTQYFLSQFGCDSVVTLNLTINYYSENHLFVTACEEYRWDVTSHTYTETGEYLYTTQNQYGCDSLITLHLTIHLPVSHEINIIETDSYLWELTGDTYYESGTYSYTLYGGSANGCDSTIILNLTIDTSSIGISSPEGFFASTVLLYPNPASSSINISTQIGEELVWIKLYDVSGKELYTIEGIKHNMITIPVDIYAKGLYFVKIKTNREELMKKLIIR